MAGIARNWVCMMVMAVSLVALTKTEAVSPVFLAAFLNPKLFPEAQTSQMNGAAHLIVDSESIDRAAREAAIADAEELLQRHRRLRRHLSERNFWALYEQLHDFWGLSRRDVAENINIMRYYLPSLFAVQENLRSEQLDPKELPKEVRLTLLRYVIAKSHFVALRPSAGTYDVEAWQNGSDHERVTDQNGEYNTLSNARSLLYKRSQRCLKALKDLGWKYRQKTKYGRSDPSAKNSSPSRRKIERITGVVVRTFSPFQNSN